MQSCGPDLFKLSLAMVCHVTMLHNYSARKGEQVHVDVDGSTCTETSCKCLFGMCLLCLFSCHRASLSGNTASSSTVVHDRYSRLAGRNRQDHVYHCSHACADTITALVKDCLTPLQQLPAAGGFLKVLMHQDGRRLPVSLAAFNEV